MASAMILPISLSAVGRNGAYLGDFLAGGAAFESFFSSATTAMTALVWTPASKSNRDSYRQRRLHAFFRIA